MPISCILGTSLLNNNGDIWVQRGDYIGYKFKTDTKIDLYSMEIAISRQFKASYNGRKFKVLLLRRGENGKYTSIYASNVRAVTYPSDEYSRTLFFDTLTLEPNVEYAIGYRIDNAEMYVPCDINNSSTENNLGKVKITTLSDGNSVKFSDSNDYLVDLTTTSRNNTVFLKLIFNIHNQSPTISNMDRDLGNKNTGFNINYTVSDADNNNLTVTEKLNGNILRTLSNAPKNQELSITISDEMLYKLPLNKQNTITIEVNDNNGGIAFRNYTFTRTNTAPIISDSNRDLGVVDRNIKQTYTIHDEEGNSISVTEKLDNIVLKSFIAEDNKEYIISIPETNWITLPNGKHTLTITATDSNNATSIRTYTFIKKENKIVLELKKPFSTDAKANKILITPVWQNIDKANVKVEVCNNALDSEKTWEDATKEVLSNNKYSFKNNNKTSEKWGINIKFTIEKKEGVEEEIYFNGFGGAFE